MTAASFSRMRVRKRPPRGGLSGGPSRARTGDLRAASATLSQLSYGPERGLRKCSAEFEIACHPDPAPLVVPRRRQPKMKLRSAVDCLVRDQVAPVEVWCICRERVELPCDVGSPDDAGDGSPRRVRPDDQHVSVKR